MNKKKLGIGTLITVAILGIWQVATLPPKPFEIPAVPDTIPLPKPPALTAYDMPTGQVAVSNEPYFSTFRSVSLEDLTERNLNTGVYPGTPYWKQREQWFKAHLYVTLASRYVG